MGMQRPFCGSVDDRGRVQAHQQSQNQRLVFLCIRKANKQSADMNIKRLNAVSRVT